MRASLIYFLTILLAVAPAFGEGIPDVKQTDVKRFGIGTSTDDKEIEFNTGDSPNNVKLKVDDSQNGSFNTNQMTFGDGNASNKSIIMDRGGSNPVLRWDESTQKWQFSNDGGAFKNIGAGGGGGGINFLTDFNPDFEAGDPPTAWTASLGGTFTAEVTTPLRGAQSGRFDATATSQTVKSTAITLEQIVSGRKCSADFFYHYDSTQSDYRFKILEGGSLEIVDIAIPPTNDGGTDLTGHISTPQFDCPAPGVTLEISIESTADGDPLVIDEAFLGTDKNQFSLAEATIYGTSRWSGSGCQWQGTSGSFASYPTDSDCVETRTGQAVAASADVPSIRFQNLPAGKYHVFWAGQMAAGSATTCGWVISDGTNEKGFLRSLGDEQHYNLDAVFEFATDQADVTFELLHIRTAGASNCVTSAGGTNNEVVEFVVQKFPANETSAITFETMGESWDVNIGGANPSLGTSAVSAYTEITDTGLDMVVNTAKGSKAAEIPCSSTNPSTGLTCSAGDESLGIVIDITTAGKYEVCGDFTHAAEADAAGSVNTTFQWIETPNNSQTILQEGDTRVSSGPDNSSSTSQGTQIPLRVCGSFSFSSAGQKTLRLMFEQSVNATVNSSILTINRSATNGQRDMHITVKKDSQQVPLPVNPDLTASLNQKIENDDGAGPLFMGTARIDQTGAHSVSEEFGTWIQSVADIGVGQTDINFTASKFSVAPHCFCTARLNGPRVCNVHSINTSQVQVRIEDVAGSAQDTEFYIQCIGPQ